MFSPVSFRVSCGLDNLGGHYEFLLDNYEASVVLVLVAVVCARIYSYELTLSESIDTVWDDLVRSKNHAKSIIFQELVHPIWSKLHDVILS